MKIVERDAISKRVAVARGANRPHTQGEEQIRGGRIAPWANSAAKGQIPAKVKISERRAPLCQVRSRRHSHRLLFGGRTHEAASRGRVALEHLLSAPMPSRRLRLDCAWRFPGSAGEGRLARTGTAAKSRAAGGTQRATANTSQRQRRRWHVDGENPLGAREENEGLTAMASMRLTG